MSSEFSEKHARNLLIQKLGDSGCWFTATKAYGKSMYLFVVVVVVFYVDI